MRASSVLAFAVCVVLSISVIRGGRKTDKTADDENIRQGGEFSMMTVSKGVAKRTGYLEKKRAKLEMERLLKAMERARRLKYVWKRPEIDSTCRDLAPKRCNKYRKAYGVKIRNNCHKLPGRFAKRMIRKCKKTCGLCENEGNKSGLPQEARRRRLPFPQFEGPQYKGRGDRDTPRSGVYYIFTRRLSL